MGKSLPCKREDLHSVSAYTQDVVGAGGRSVIPGLGWRQEVDRPFLKDSLETAQPESSERPWRMIET